MLYVLAWRYISPKEGASFPQFDLLKGLSYCNSPNDAIWGIDDELLREKKRGGTELGRSRGFNLKMVGMQTYIFTRQPFHHQDFIQP